jgi:hypothetical protein
MEPQDSNKEDRPAEPAGDAITVKIPKSVVYVIIATLVLTAMYVIGSTIKERVTDPALDQVAAAAAQVADARIAKAAADKAEALWKAEGAISPGLRVAGVRPMALEDALPRIRQSLELFPDAQLAMDLAAIESGELKCYPVIVELESVDGITPSSEQLTTYVTEDDQSGLRQIGYTD